MMRVVADIGGTNARFAMYESGVLNSVSVYPTRDFGDCQALVKAYLEERGISGQATRGCTVSMAVAATIQDEVATGVNIPWAVDARSLKKTFSFKEVILLNDFEAAAWGVTGLSPEDVLPIGTATPRSDSNLCVLGAGTGLGEAIIVPCPRRRFHVLPTEGGHADFFPSSQEEWALFNFLRKRYGHVSVERVVSGPGLSDTYEFITGRRLVPSEVAQLALKEKEDKALKAIEIFIKNYAKEASNLALKSLSFGGVYIAGGIAPKIKDAFFDLDFRKAFEDKGRMAHILKDIPVFICLHPHLGLLGAGIRSDLGPT